MRISFGFLLLISLILILDISFKLVDRSTTQLSRQILPRLYKLDLDIDPRAKRYSGSVLIYLLFKNQSQQFVLHNQVEISKVTVDGIPFEFVQRNDKVFISTKGTEPGEHLLFIQFSGSIHTTQQGFFVDGNNVTLSHFEPIKARSAFPCFDEPFFKSEFQVSIRVPLNYSVLSNTFARSITTKEKSIYEFEKTIPLPTYLIAWAIFDNLKVVEQPIDEFWIRIYYHEQTTTLSQANYALKTAIKCIEYFSRTFFPLPLKKIDIVSIKDFHAEGMENMGLITLDSIALQVDEHSTNQEKRYAALLITHEIAHHYFGNLATIKNWKALWLNEGFAEFMQYLATDAIFPQLNILQYFFDTEHEEALSIDASTYSHAIEPPHFQGFLFDGITYNKGASCLWMMYHYIQKNTLNGTVSMALKQYLLEHPFGLVTTSDLLKSLSTSTGLDLIHQFNPWIKSKGYPVVKVSIASIESSSITFHFEQTKFQLWKTKESQDLWPIVLNATIVIRNSSGTKFETISTRLDDKATKYSYTIPNGYQFQSFLLNPDRIGFYRTLYSQDLLDHVNLLPFGISDKSGFISDLIALLLSGHYKLDSNWLDRFFSRLHFIQNDTTVEVWESFLNHVSKVEVAIRSSKYHDMLLRGIHSILEPIMKKMTWQTKKHPLESIKSEIFLSAVKYNHQPTINQAIAYFNTSDYDPFLINVVTEAAIRYDGRFDQVCKSIETGNFKPISVLAATQDISQQAMLIKHYINTVQLHDILVKLLDYGNFEIVWRTIKDFEFGNVSKFDLLLEETTSQFQSKTLIRDAKRRKTRGIQRGLEKANAYKHLRATLIKT